MLNKPEVSWEIKIKDEKFLFTRKVNGLADETYRPADSKEASVWSAAIIHGFQPPQVLRNSDIQIVETGTV